MTNATQEIDLINIEEAERILPRDNVVHISKNVRGQWMGTFISGKCDRNITVMDEFASFTKALGEIKDSAARRGVKKLYYKRC